MTYGIASLIFIPLLAISMAHFLWAFGSTWPVQDHRTLARTVTGFRDAPGMPPRFISAAVAVLTLGAGIWALFMTDEAPNAVLTAGGVLLTLVFLGRGLAGYTPQWRELTPEEPFATFDTKLYSPLCIGLGLGFALLTYWRLT